MRKKLLSLLLIPSMLLSICLLGCGSKSTETASTSKTITDQAGRKVTIPSKIEKIYCTSPLGTIFVYSLAPEKIVALNEKFSDEGFNYLTPELKKLPVAGSLQGKKSGNIEEITKLKPDIIISMGDINDSTKSAVEKFQQQSNIPFVLVDGKMDKLPEAYRFVSDILNLKDKGEELSKYCEKTLDTTKKNIANISDDKKVKVYYAEGPKGLETDPEGSLHSEVIKYAGGKNVVQTPPKTGKGRTSVSMEQLMAWNPDVIVADSKAFNTESWKQLSAVKNNKIYVIPNLPFSWFDKPPSINRLLGIKWMQSSLYPDSYKEDIVKDTIGFFKLFYHKDITEKEALKLLNK